MGSSSAQILAVILTFIGTIFALIALLSPSWATEHIDRFDTMKQMADGHYFGLWMRCEHFSTGVFTCDHYDNLLMGASKELIGGRVGMIAGGFLDILGILIMMAAIDCTTMLPARKRRTLRMWAGILILIGGIAMLVVSVVFFVVIGKHFNESQMYRFQYQMSRGGMFRRDVDDLGAALTKQMKAGGLSMEEDMFQGKHMTFSTGVFCAAGAGILSMIGGVLLLCQGCGRDEDDELDEYQQGIVRNRCENEYL